MFSSTRARYQEGSFSKHRASKSKSSKKNPSFKDSQRKVERLAQHHAQLSSPHSNQTSPMLSSAIITISVGREQRLFAAHEDVLSHSPYLQLACQGQFYQTANKRIDLPDEDPEVFSSLLEYLYKGDYYPRIEYDKKRNSWYLEDCVGNGTNSHEAVIQSSIGPILKDTIIYCQAEKYGLQELKKLALKKQGLQSGIQCSTVLTSARFAYANTPDDDSKLRAHYLALIIRARHTFKRSGTMQNEMELGGKLFFDLFVAMVNHMDDLSQKSPR